MKGHSSGSGREGIARQFLIVFAAAVLLYALTYYTVEHLRTRKGGWQITFQTDQKGVPAVLVTQPWLGITNVGLEFPGARVPQTNLLSQLIFDRPITNIPFGRVIYFDTTFLPGAVVFELFGNEVQLLPRVLILNRKESPWRSETTHRLDSK